MNVFNIKSSKILASAILLLNIIALISILYTSLPLWITIILLAIFATDLIHTIAKISLKTASAITQLNYHNDDWLLQNNAGKSMRVKLQGTSFASNLFLVLHFKCAAKKFILPIVIFNDALDKKSFRTLRALLTLSIKNTK
jgi:hypothetical protein